MFRVLGIYNFEIAAKFPILQLYNWILVAECLVPTQFTIFLFIKRGKVLQNIDQMKFWVNAF